MKYYFDVVSSIKPHAFFQLRYQFWSLGFFVSKKAENASNFQFLLKKLSKNINFSTREK